MAQSSVGHVFMSYSRKDEAVMQRITMFLRSHDINVWVDNEKLVPGTATWKKAIERAIKEAAVVFVLLSPASYNSIWVEREISFAESHEKTIFPILIDGNERNSIPITLVNHQRIDIRQNEDVGLRILLTALSSFLKKLETHEQGASAEKVISDKAKDEVPAKATQKKVEREPAEIIKRKKNIATYRKLGRNPLPDETILFYDTKVYQKQKATTHKSKLTLTSKRLIFWDKVNHKYSFEISISILKQAEIKGSWANNVIITIPTGQKYKFGCTDKQHCEDVLRKINRYI